MLGSVTRFSHKKGSGGLMNETVKEKEEHDQEAAALNNARQAIIRYQDRKASHDSSVKREHHSANLKKIRARVDCWNRSATRDDTPNQLKKSQTIDPQ